MTEGNMAASGPMVGKPHEHGMGRALAEATIFPERIRTYATLIYHDLVRSHPPGKQGQSWFARLYYYPENPPGKRYGLPTDAAVMRIMNEHAQREIIYADNGICVSQNADGLLLSACNPLPMECPFEFDLQNLTTGGTVHADILHAENLDTARYKKQTRPIALSPVSEETTLRFKAPKFSFTSIRIPAE
jgi:hypothetical protein